MINKKYIKAFSLVEVTLALGIVAFGLVSIVGLVPVGLNAAKSAVDSTKTCLIAQDVSTRVVSSITTDTQFGSIQSSGTSLGPWFYDVNGTYLGTVSSGTALYSAQAMIAPFQSTSSTNLPNVNSNVLQGVTVTIGWPVNAQGNVAGANAAGKSYTFYLRAP
jgi:uncharacterized protein (TIGR02598 family)